MGNSPPVQLYQVGEQYYVGDRHHRLPVAHALGVDTIQVEVWGHESLLCHNKSTPTSCRRGGSFSS